MSERERLLFVAPWFLFPRASGGRIRTTDILRGMKGGRFEITLVSPQASDGRDWSRDVDGLCDRFSPWADDTKRSTMQRVRGLASSLPVSVALDRSKAASTCIREQLQKRPDVAVFDFVHTSILAPEPFEVPTVVFTHNVESEIYARTADVSDGFLKRTVWRGQARKMESFERDHLRRFDVVVAVSERDGEAFRERFGVDNVRVIPTSVDVDFYDFQAPAESGDLVDAEPTLVFTGSMDWFPNIDGIRWLMEDVWPRVVQLAPKAKLVIVGRDPDPGLVADVEARGLPWKLTGFVDDVRPFVHGADVCVIPLRVGGGTRLKAYEAMALGCPVVSTALGVEGLPLRASEHYLLADEPADFAAAISTLLRDGARRRRMAAAAREFVAANFSAAAVARVFESICSEAAAGRTIRS